MFYLNLRRIPFNQIVLSLRSKYKNQLVYNIIIQLTRFAILFLLPDFKSNIFLPQTKYINSI
jgi:hypothetical protein